VSRRLPVTVSTAIYDRVAALRDGRIRPEGVELTWLDLRVEEIFWRMLQHSEFDVAEISLSGYTLQRARGVDDFVAIPVFLSRTFRHECIYVNAAAGIERPEDLAGRTMGVPEYQMTAAVWSRGLLSDEYGVKPGDLDWIQGGLEQPGRVPFVPVEPEGVRLRFPDEGKTLATMLAEGELDVLISPRTPSTFDDGTGRVVRLFPQPWVAEREYFARTGIFPIMHTVAIRRELLEANPWLAVTLFKAFHEAKNVAMAALRDTTALPLTLPFLLEHAATTAELMGDDFWAYGIEPNRAVIETLMRYLVEQRMIDEPLPVESLFAPTTHRMRLGI
jgi:4,5-dihydroxyphthalate decarboxylase